MPHVWRYHLKLNQWVHSTSSSPPQSHTYHSDDGASRCAFQSGGGLTFVSKYSSHFVHTKRIGERERSGRAALSSFEWGINFGATSRIFWWKVAREGEWKRTQSARQREINKFSRGCRDSVLRRAREDYTIPMQWWNVLHLSSVKYTSTGVRGNKLLQMLPRKKISY